MDRYDSGARNFYMSKAPVKRIENLRGKKIRVMQSETAIQPLKLLGTSPIAMSQAEVYTLLQQGILDGAENNEFALTIARHGEVARYYTYDMHTRIPDILLMSTLTQKKLTPEQQRIVKAAIQASIEFEKAAWDKEIEKTRLAAVQPIYDRLKNKPRLYGLYQRIQIAKN